jgi:rubrerythrin
MREKDKEKKRKKKVPPVCLYCGLNVVRGKDPYCCPMCEKYDREYREWLEASSKKS